MSTASAVRAGRAYVELGADDSALRSAMRAAEARLKQFGAGLQSIGSKMLGTGLGLAAPLGLATQQYADFEQQMARTRGLLGLEKTEEMFRSLSEEAKRLGRETVFTAGEAAQAMSVFALAGMKAGDILKATGPTLDLAAAGQLNMAQAADISMKVMAGMGIETNRLGYAIDVLTKAMTTANTDLVMLGEAFKYVGPVAKAAGLSFEETTAAIQMLSNAGMQADMAGTTLRGAILSLTSPSQEALTMLRQLGVAVTDARGNFRPLVDIIGDLENALKGMGTGRQLEVIGTIFANRQATGIAELVSQGAGKLREMTASLTKAGQEKVSSRIAGVQLDTLIGSWKIFTSAVEGVAVAIGEALAPTLRAWGDSIIAITTAVNRIVIINSEWLPLIAETAGSLIVVGGALWTAGAAFKVLAFGLGWTSTLAVVGSKAFLGLGRALLFVLNPLGLLKTAFVTLPLAIVKYGAIGVALAIAGIGSAVMFLLTPLGLVTAAFAGLVTYMVGFSDAGRGAWAEVGKGFQNLAATITKAWGGISDAFMAGDLALAGKIAFKAIHLAWNQLVVSMGAAWRTFIDGITRDARIVGVRVKYDTGLIDRAEYDRQLLEIVAPGQAAFDKQREAKLNKWRTEEWAKRFGTLGEAGVGTYKDVQEGRIGRDSPQALLLSKLLGVVPETLARGNMPTEEEWGGGRRLAPVQNQAKTPWELETEKLQKELDDLVEAARKARADFEKKGQPVDGEAFVGPLQRPGLPTSDQVMQAVAAATQGTFSADVANRLGGGTASKVEQQNEEMIRQQRLAVDLHQEEIRILRRMATGGGFS